MHTMSVKASALALGLTFVIMGILSLIVFGASIFATIGVPQVEGDVTAVGVILSLVVLFIDGLIFGALATWLYNKFAEGEVTRRSERDAFAV